METEHTFKSTGEIEFPGVNAFQYPLLPKPTIPAICPSGAVEPLDDYTAGLDDARVIFDAMRGVSVPGGLRIAVGDLAESEAFQIAHKHGWFDDRPIRRHWLEGNFSGGFYIWPKPRIDANAPAEVYIGLADSKACIPAGQKLRECLLADPCGPRGVIVRHQPVQDVLDLNQCLQYAEQANLDRQPGRIFHYARNLVSALACTGQTNLAKPFHTMLEPFVSGRYDIPFAGGSVEFWASELIVGWWRTRLLPEWPNGWSDIMDNFLLRVGRYCYGILTKKKERIGPDDLPIANHQTWAALSIDWAERYFRAWLQQYAPDNLVLRKELDDWRSISRECFRRLMRT